MIITIYNFVQVIEQILNGYKIQKEGKKRKEKETLLKERNRNEKKTEPKMETMKKKKKSCLNIYHICQPIGCTQI